MAAKKRVVEMPLASPQYAATPEAIHVVPDVAPDVADDAAPGVKKQSMRAAVAEARRRIAGALPRAVDALAEQSIGGSVTHLRLFMEVSGLLKGGLQIRSKAVREKTVEELLDEEWAKQKAMLGDECRGKRRRDNA